MPIQRKENKDITIKRKDTAAGDKPVKRPTNKTKTPPPAKKDKQK